MAQYYYGANGTEITCHKADNDFLDRLIYGLFSYKIGIPRPISKENALIVSRMLYNFAQLQRLTLNGEAEQYAWKFLGYEQFELDEIEWAEKTAEFFEKSGGLITEEEWEEKYGTEDEEDEY